MGYYVNPRNETKEAFLLRMGIELDNPYWPGAPEDADYAIVCLVDNGPFKAIGIAYSADELAEFARAEDHRPKRWFLIEKCELYKVSDIKPESFRY